MALANSHNTDASGSTFTDVGRDQIINIFISGQVQPESFLRTLDTLNSNMPHRHLSDPNAHSHTALLDTDICLSSLSRTEAMMVSRLSPSPRSTITSAIDVGEPLIIQIVECLQPDRSRHDQDLKLLRGLQQMLALTRLAMETCERVPIGHSLSRSINREVEECSTLLQELLAKVKRQNLSLASISLFRTRVLSGSDLEWWGSIRRKLSGHQESLGQYLMALKLLSWIKESQTDCSPFTSFYAYLQQGPGSLRDIQVNMISVTDHLGRTIPIPTVFCSSWESVDYIIKCYCEKSAGYQFIQRGEYRMINADNEVVRLSSFASYAGSGRKFEMSIVMRRKEKFTRTCPRCGRSHYRTAEHHGWITCHGCSKEFEVTTKRCPRCRNLDLNVSSTNNWIQCCHCAGQFQVQEEGRADSEIEEIFSPASRSETSSKRATIDKEFSQERVECDAQFFRRIHLIHPENEILSIPPLSDPMVALFGEDFMAKLPPFDDPTLLSKADFGAEFERDFRQWFNPEDPLDPE